MPLVQGNRPMLSIRRNINAAAIMNAKAFMWNKRAEVPSSKGIKKI